MKKLLLATLLSGMVFSATAAETIRFAASATYPPFESMDANNEIVGFDMDLAKALCKQMEAKCTFTNQAFDSLIPALKFKRYDAVISGMMQVQLATGVPVLSAVLTPHHFHAGHEHQEFYFQHFKVKGVELATACAATIHSLQRLAQPASAPHEALAA